LPKAALSLCVALLAAACGRSFSTPSTSQIQLAPADALKCVLDQFKKLGFQRISYDTDEFRASGRRVNPKITVSDVQFRKTWDRLDIEITPGASGTELEVTPSTAAEYFSQAGQRYNQLETSKEAQEAAATIQRECSNASPDAIPEPTP
jgi:hypothetical protein